MKIFLWLGLSILSIISGICGRLGGKGKPYKTWMRDWLIPLFCLITLWQFQFNIKFWWIYLITYILIGLSLTTYWDWLFGFDNLWFSGFMTGLSIFPYIIINQHWIKLVIYSLTLAVIWGSLNKIKYDKIFFWRKDVVEEFLRYTAIIIVLPILL